LQGSGARALLVGTNGPMPRLLYWSEGSPPQEGERVVTSAEAGAFPAGLPVGIVHYSAAKSPEVEPYAHLERLQLVRIFDYKLTGILPPESARPGSPTDPADK
jgi:rod shape-determining protein MreC